MNKKGFTLIEMMVAVSIFSLVIGASSGLLISSIKNQRRSLATQEILDQTSYLMEYMSRTLRMAKKDMAGTCTGTPKLNYAFVGQCIKFRNYKDECQEFCLVGDRLQDKDGNYLTSDSLRVSNFSVILAGQNQPPIDYFQPRVTIFLEINGKEESRIRIQTSVSQRNPDVRN